MSTNSYLSQQKSTTPVKRANFSRSDDDYLTNEIRNFMAEMKKMQANHNKLEKLIEIKEQETKDAIT